MAQGASAPDGEEPGAYPASGTPREDTKSIGQVEPASPRTVFVIMAVHDPDFRFLREQIGSIAGQDFSAVVLVVVFDGEDSAAEAEVRSFQNVPVTIVRLPGRLGVLRAFELGLKTALRQSRSENDLFAFADQDDIWITHKLTRLARELDLTLSTAVYSDAQVIDASDTMVIQSLFSAENRLRNPALGELLVSNSASGMTMLFNKRLAEAGLPFPETSDGVVLHDWWIALLGSSLGTISFVPEQLVGYRLHSSNVIGARLGGSGLTTGRGTFMQQCMRHFRIRRELARSGETAIRRAGGSCPRALRVVARGGLACCVYMLFQAAALLLVRGRKRMSFIALGTAIGSLCALLGHA